MTAPDPADQPEATTRAGDDPEVALAGLIHGLIRETGTECTESETHQPLCFHVAKGVIAAEGAAAAEPSAEAIERAAQAARQAAAHGDSWVLPWNDPLLPDATREYWRRIARAVIAALAKERRDDG